VMPEASKLQVTSDCGIAWAAPVYYTSFFMFGVYLMLNLFIAVIIDNFSNVYNKETNLITQEHLEEFRAVWRKYDRQATGYIPIQQLWPFVQNLDKMNNNLVYGLVQSKLLYGLLYADMHQAAKKREAFTMGFNPLQLLSGLISKKPDKSGLMPSDVVEEEEDNEYTIQFNQLLESCAVLQMGMTAMDYQERLVMEEKHRKLKRDVAASLIGSTIRAYLARKKIRKQTESNRKRREIMAEIAGEKPGEKVNMDNLSHEEQDRVTEEQVKTLLAQTLVGGHARFHVK